jgi:8-amino-7-oxononanoate synthase
MDFVNAELNRLEAVNQRRILKRLWQQDAHRVCYAGKTLVSFSSNDYLALASHPRVKAAAAAALEQHHASAASSRLVCGNLQIHEQLEEELARFKQREAALVFSSGYLANLGILTALAGEPDQIFSDALNHASIIDGCRLSSARVFVYRHQDMDHLETLLQQAPAARRRLLVSDAVFSMDGDVADLPALISLAEAHDCLLILDEAHATGVLGPSGRGIVEHFTAQGLIPKDRPCVHLEIGTLSKAVGSFGGFVACSASMREFLINKSRSLIFSTALPPASAGAAIEGIRLIQEEPFHRETLWRNVDHLKSQLLECGLDVDAAQTPILPLTLGEEAAALSMSKQLIDRGYFVPAIRPPSVPKGTSRLRVTVSAAHSAEEIAGFGEALTALTQRAVTGR